MVCEYFLTSEADSGLVERLKTLFSGKVSSLNNITKNYEQSDLFIMIMPISIAILSLSPLLANEKKRQPAVILIDPRGEFVIPLIPGWLGQGTFWSRQIADELQIKLILTSNPVSSKKSYFSRTAKEQEWQISNLKSLQKIDYLIEQGVGIEVHTDQKIGNILGDEEFLGLKIKKYDVDRGHEIIQAYEFCKKSKRPAVFITIRQLPDQDALVSPEEDLQLILTPQNLVLGISCRNLVNQDYVYEAFSEMMENQKLAWNSIKHIVTIPIMSKETAVLTLADRLQINLFSVSVEQVRKVQIPLPNHSVLYRNYGSIENLSTACAYVGSNSGRMILSKRNFPGGVSFSVSQIRLI